MTHSRGPIFHAFSERFKTRYRSFSAASSVGKLIGPHGVVRV
jgi:hypothetical protein